MSKHADKHFMQTNNQNLIQLDFDNSIENIITKISNIKDIFINSNTSFFIDFPENETNLVLDNTHLMNLIKNKLYQKNKNIYFLPEEIVEKYKTKLGISNKNNNLTTNIAILLSRQNHIKYYLRSSLLLSEKKYYSFKIELIAVETGEIIFTEIEKLYYQHNK